MARAQPRYVCQACGAVHPKWTGRCEGCGGWNSLVEELPREAPPGSAKRAGHPIAFVGLAGPSLLPPRRRSGIAEFDRVCGGGLVAGSALLVGGDPGIGKSTLLLQVAAALAAPGPNPAASAPTSPARSRSTRCGCAPSASASPRAPVQLAGSGDVRDIVASLDRAGAPDFVVVDSIQTMYLDTLDSAPGSVSQVRAAAQELIRLAKRRGFILILVGHVTKEGAIAGPRVLEHMVDTVLYFEGERGHQFRILRAVKNRFGADRRDRRVRDDRPGLVEVPNPSALFLAGRSAGSGRAALVPDR